MPSSASATWARTPRRSRHGSALSGTAPRGARLRDRHGAAAGEGSKLGARLGRVPDPRPQPRVVGEVGAAGVGRARALRRQPRDLPVLPRQGPPVPPARELRPGQRILVRASNERPALPARRSRALAVERGASSTWEYYFDYGGASPPGSPAWPRAPRCRRSRAARSGSTTPLYLEVAKRALGAFERGTPTGVRSPQGQGDWYPLYSFAPKLNVLNGMLQAVNGHAHLRGDRRRLGRAAAVRGRRSRGAGADLRATTPAPGRSTAARAASRAPRRASTTTRSTATSRATSAGRRDAEPTARRRTTSRAYLKEDPTAGSGARRSRTGPGRQGRASSASSCRRSGAWASPCAPAATHVPRRPARRSRTASATSAGCRRASKRERTYTYTLFARDLAGNTASTTGDVRVQARCARRSADGDRGGVESPPMTPRTILYTGKGGVGKTSVAAATALADRPQRPAHGRALDRSRAQPVGLARGGARAAADAGRAEPLGAGGAGRGGAGAQLAGGAALARRRCSRTAASTRSWPRS